MTLRRQIVFELPELGRMGGALSVNLSRCHDQVDQLMDQKVPEYLLGNVGAVQNLVEANEAFRCRDATRDAAKE
jgi:hypothetical protein